MDWCKNCAIKLYNTKHHNIQGVGNPWGGNCIVVPNVDYSAYKHGDMGFSNHVKIIENILFPFTGVQDSNLYILPLIRCNEKISCELDNASYHKCLHYFGEDVEKYNFKHILLLGTAAKRFLNTDIKPYLNTLFVSKNNRIYSVNYSPFVKYVDSEYFDTFVNNLVKWYNLVLFNDYNEYQIQRI